MMQTIVELFTTYNIISWRYNFSISQATLDAIHQPGDQVIIEIEKISKLTNKDILNVLGMLLLFHHKHYNHKITWQAINKDIK